MTIYQQNQRFVAALMARLRARAKAESERVAALKQRARLLAALAGVEVEEVEEVEEPKSAFARALFASRAKRSVSEKERYQAALRG
jgi:hypothetical protein